MKAVVRFLAAIIQTPSALGGAAQRHLCGRHVHLRLRMDMERLACMGLVA